MGRRLAAVAAVLIVAVAAAWVAWRSAPAPPPPPLGPQPPVVAMTVPSAALGRAMPVQWHLAGPAGGRASRILYLFHGRYDDEGSWFAGVEGDGVGLASIADRLVGEGRIEPVVLVSVGIDDSYGVDSAAADDGYDHGAYGTYLASELAAGVEPRLPLAKGSVKRYAAGYSMGGFAALRLVLRDPGSFAGVAGLSTAVFLEPPADREWVYAGDRDANDPVRLAATVPSNGSRAFIGWGASEGGGIPEAGQVLADELAAAGAEVLVETAPGGHDKGTWRALSPSMLAWLLTAEP